MQLLQVNTCMHIILSTTNGIAVSSILLTPFVSMAAWSQQRLGAHSSVGGRKVGSPEASDPPGGCLHARSNARRVPAQIQRSDLEQHDGHQP